MEKVLVGIIIPVYNSEKFLRECLKSIQYQTFSSFVAVIVDDGSTDRSYEICKEFCDKDSRFIYLYQSNCGVSSARNKGIDYLKKIGVYYIAMVDSDDVVHKNFVDVCVNVLKANKLAIVCCDEIVFNEKIPVVESQVSYHTVTINQPFNLNEIPCVIRLFVFDATILDGNKYGKLRFNKELSIAEDVLFVTELCIRVNKIGYIRDGLYFYRINQNSIMGSFDIEKRCNNEAHVYSALCEKYADHKVNQYVDKIIKQRKIFSLWGWTAYKILLNFIMRNMINDFINDTKQYKKMICYMRKDFFKIMFTRLIPFKDKKLFPIACFCPRVYLHIKGSSGEK